jgi:hypothetical protein
MTTFKRCTWSALAWVALAPGTAGAQTVANSFEELQRMLKPGQMVVIADDAGVETKGKVLDISASSLTILTPDQRTFPNSGVAQVRRTDSLWNGALIGAGVGGGAFGLGWLSCVYQDVGCDFWGDPGGFVTSWLAPATGAIVGALMDRAKGNEPIYRARSQPSRASFTMSPLLDKKKRGVSLAVRF